MTKLIVMCLETNKQAQTDKMYIDKILNQTYKFGNEVTFYPIFMGGKPAYKKRQVVNEIKLALKQKFDEKHVVYCIDIDQFEQSAEANKLNSDITQYCKQNGYKLVWFCKTIEDVILHEIVPDKEKVKRATKFKNAEEIEQDILNSLSASSILKQKSNILCVFDNILPRKA